MGILIVLGLFLCITAVSAVYFETVNAGEYIKYVFWSTWFALLFIFIGIAIYIAIIKEEF